MLEANGNHAGEEKEGHVDWDVEADSPASSGAMFGLSSLV